MTREEKLQQFAEQNTKGLHLDRHNLIQMVKQGAEWADQHPQWIPVEERLPEKDNEFEDYSKLVIVTNGKDFWKGMYNYGGEEWLTFDLWQIDDATHWMEFVPPRKEATNEKDFSDTSYACRTAGKLRRFRTTCGTKIKWHIFHLCRFNPWSRVHRNQIGKLKQHYPLGKLPVQERRKR